MHKIVICLGLISLTAVPQIAGAQEPSFYKCENKQVRVNIPSMPLGEAVERFTAITHCPVSIDADQVFNTDARNLPTYPVKGRMFPANLLRQMLSSTPLKSKNIRGGFSIYEEY